MDDIAAHDAPQRRGGLSIPAKDMYVRFRVEIGSTGVHVALDPFMDFIAQGAEVVIRPTNLLPDAV